ncbi:unnamed protein product [Cylicocyclus nassatus]|uniref:Uncharacterized protein n=1 Tax=Cylicocyclus nassatus TaxID=53992 RepID=A0AA36H1Z5_CYLNA|nr:unnamed protein product [Cylicocyclus nassatus]
MPSMLWIELTDIGLKVVKVDNPVKREDFRICRTCPKVWLHLINFVLDGVGLYAEELLLSATEYARQRSRFWLGLGNDDEARTKTFDKLSEARMKLNGLIRVQCNHAHLYEYRVYY